MLADKETPETSFYWIPKDPSTGSQTAPISSCGRTGFQVWAWVLMGNHYHILIRTLARHSTMQCRAGTAGWG